MDKSNVAPRRHTRQSVNKDPDSHPNIQERHAVPDMEYIKRAEDNLTDFVPTKQDLVDLANALVHFIISYHYQARECLAKSEIMMWCYSEYRLSRIVDYLPELEPEIKEKLQRGYKENKAAELRVSVEEEHIKSAGDDLTEFVPTIQDVVVIANALVYYLTNCEYPFEVCLCKSHLPTRAYAEHRLDLILREFPELKSEFEAKVRRG